MPQFKVAKTDDIKILNNKEMVEDKLYIYKETNKMGRLFYDYDDGTRIEIGSFNNTYRCIDNTLDELNDAIYIVNIDKLRKYKTDGGATTVNIDEIQVNSLIITNKALYIIMTVNREIKEITMMRLHMQDNLKWNDYYEEQNEEQNV